MLISCPKCHSVYEVPDDLVPKSGQNFRCAACSNVWNVVKTDALGYGKKDNDEIVVEAIDVKEPPYRNYPADKDDYKIVNDFKSKAKKNNEEKNWEETGYVMPNIKSKKNRELTLTSDEGTSFTISMGGEAEDENKSFFGNEKGIGETEIKADRNNRLTVGKKKEWYGKAKLFFYVMLGLAGIVIFRNSIVLMFEGAEKYYNKVGLSGYDNYRNLEFVNVSVREVIENNKKFIKIAGEIKNNGIFATKVSDVAVDGVDEVFKPNRTFLKAKEKTDVVIMLTKENEEERAYKIRFVK